MADFDTRTGRTSGPDLALAADVDLTKCTLPKCRDLTSLRSLRSIQDRNAAIPNATPNVGPPNSQQRLDAYIDSMIDNSPPSGPLAEFSTKSPEAPAFEAPTIDPRLLRESPLLRGAVGLSKIPGSITREDPRTVYLPDYEGGEGSGLLGKTVLAANVAPAAGLVSEKLGKMLENYKPRVGASSEGDVLFEVDLTKLLR